MLYERLIRPILFRIEPERIHDFFVGFGEWLGKFSATRNTVRTFCHFEHPSLRTVVRGMRFKNPVGLAAGFDKDVRLTRIMPDVGFGFMEVGAVTYHPYGGNEGKRLLRLPKDKSLIVYYGLKSIGANAVLKKLQARISWRIPIGINIAKTNRADIKGEKSIEDYVNTYKLLSPHFAYVTLNVSCPNAQDGCMFQDPTLLESLLAAVGREKKHVPIFLKISNHLTRKEIDEMLVVVARHPFVDGFVISNLSKNREILTLKSSKEYLDTLPYGGISGKPIQKISTDLIRYVYQKTKGKYVIIGVGGIFTAEDAYEKIKAGASLVQIITGLIYEGPTVVKKINKGLVELLMRDGYGNISEAIGVEAK